MPELRLLERLRYIEDTPEHQAERSVLELQSILDHIKKLLGTHKGTVPISNDYGMPDVFFSQGINFTESSRRMHDSIAQVITRFETRLKRVKVELLSTREDLLKQQFRITAVLSRDLSIPLNFTVAISSEAEITLTSGNIQG